MDTKLKKFNDNMLVRVLAFIMCVALFVASIVAFWSVVVSMYKADRNLSFEGIWGNFNYAESIELHQEMQDKAYELKDLICYYKSEENIKAGGLLSRTSDDLEEALMQLYYNGSYETGSQVIRATWSKSDYDQDDYASDYDIEQDAELMTRFIEKNTAQVEQIKALLIKKQLREYEQRIAEFNREKGISYYATNGKDVITNIDGNVTSANFKRNPAYMIYENGVLEKLPKSENNRTSWIRGMDADLEELLFGQYNDNLKVYMGYSKAYLAERQAGYGQLGDVRETGIFAILAGVGCIILFLYLAITTGRKREDGQRKLYTIDGMWTEVQLCAIGAAIFGGVWTTAVCYNYSVASNSLEGMFLIGTYAVEAMVGLWFMLSAIRLLKARNFIKSSLVYKLWHLVIHRMCGKLWKGIKAVYNGSSLMKKIVLCAFGICLLSATIFLAPVVFLATVVFAPRWVNKFESIKKGVEEVKNGNLSHKIPVEGTGELDRLAESINEISEASSVAVRNELKNQRMKTELISNVSHDLKTPLTSMVTYIDLLKKEGLDSENAPEYLRVLDEKTERLRHLTEDLFEAAKASSGAMPVHLERVEILSLINQGLGEMDSKIKELELDFIINAEQEKYYVMADGQLLWRVVENLLGNVFKYALEKSRVYIDIKELKTKNEVTTSIITMEMKNISKNPLNINADELMERFKRGDEARTTEGSGLGLAIAKDLVKLQNGWFEVFVDGDLFKAQVMLTKYQEPVDNETEKMVQLKKD